MAPKTERQKQSQKNYMAKVVRFGIIVPPDFAEKMRVAAAATGLSVNAYVRRVIAENMEADAPAAWIDDGPDVKCPRCGGCIDGEAYFLLRGNTIKYCPYCGKKIGAEQMGMNEGDNNGAD